MSIENWPMWLKTWRKWLQRTSKSPKLPKISKSCQNSKKLPKISKVAEKLPSNLWLSLVSTSERAWVTREEARQIVRRIIIYTLHWGLSGFFLKCLPRVRPFHKYRAESLRYLSGNSQKIFLISQKSLTICNFCFKNETILIHLDQKFLVVVELGRKAWALRCFSGHFREFLL